jgi:hypothetical protein
MMKNEPARERGADSDYAKSMEEQVAARVRLFSTGNVDIFCFGCNLNYANEWHFVILI